MKIELAIEILELKHQRSYDTIEPALEACRMGAKALKKQLPMPLDYEADGYDEDGDLIYDTAICRSCGRRFEIYYDEHTAFCPGCGQAINWNEAPDPKKAVGYVVGMNDDKREICVKHILDGDGNEKVFPTWQEAVDYLFDHGFTDDDIANGKIFLEEVKE